MSWPVPISPKHKTLHIDQCRPGVVFFLYYLGIYNEDIAFLILVMYGNSMVYSSLVLFGSI